MAREIDKIISSKTAPKDKNVIWDDGKTLNIYRNGKWESTGLSSEQQDMIQKLLDAYGDLPEDLNSIKELANTPTDFLNNSNKLGGLVNMPFGYTNLDYTDRKSIFFTPQKDIAVLLFSTREVGGYIGVSSSTYGYQQFVNFLHIIGENNGVELNGPFILYTEINNGIFDVYIKSTSSYYPVYINFIPFAFSDSPQFEKLPLVFTTPYIVGNDTQEHLDELYRRLGSEGTFNTLVIFKYFRNNAPFTIYGYGHFQRTYGNNYILNILRTYGDGDFYRVIIGRPSGQDLKSLITLDSIDESIIIEESELVPAPDWNAGANDIGHIANRTHYISGYEDKEIFQGETSNYNEKCALEPDIEYTISIPNITLSNGNSYSKKFVLNAGDIGKRNIIIDAGIVDRYHIEYDSVDHYIRLVEPVLANLIYYNYIITRKSPLYKPLDEQYIPDTIARKDDYELPHITFWENDADKNLELLSGISSSNVYSCDVYLTMGSYEKTRPRLRVSNGEYFNGVITAIRKGRLVQYDVSFETGAITEHLNIDLELISSEVKLDVCTAGSTEAARNLELLNKAYFALGDHFTVNIDAGIGVAKFIPESGGEGHITTAEGVNVHYTIGADGSVVKTMEIDIVELYNKVEAMSITE